MLARERLMPAPGRARRRSAYLGGAKRVSTRRVTSDWTSVVPRRTAAFALRWRRLAWGDAAAGSAGRPALGERGERFIEILPWLSRRRLGQAVGRGRRYTNQ
jgi:hypothetical protein